MFAPVYILLGYLDNIETKLKVVHNSKFKKSFTSFPRDLMYFTQSTFLFKVVTIFAC